MLNSATFSDTRPQITTDTYLMNILKFGPLMFALEKSGRSLVFLVYSSKYCVQPHYQFDQIRLCLSVQCAQAVAADTDLRKGYGLVGAVAARGSYPRGYTLTEGLRGME